MKRILYLLFLPFLLSSCLDEYEVFYPYRNSSLSYLSELQNETISFEFTNDSKFEHLLENGMLIEIPANTFPDNEKKLSLKLDIRSTVGELIQNRISMVQNDHNLFAGEYIINYDIQDQNKNSIELDDNQSILFKIPYDKQDFPTLFRFNNGHWEIANSEIDQYIKNTWNIGSSENPIIQKGYIVNTKTTGVLCLGSSLDPENEISDFRVKLPKDFTVDNSIVQVTIAETNCSLELYWDNEQSSFRLPPDIIIPSNNVGIIALSENSEHQAFFGMKYAQIKNGEVFSLELERKRVEEIKSILDSL